MKQYAVRVEVYVDADHPDEAREQVERLMAGFRGAPWIIRYIRGMTPADQQLLEQKRAAEQEAADNSPNEHPQRR